MTALAPGDVFGGYRIEAVAGRGGMGVVYRAVQLDGGARRGVAHRVRSGRRSRVPRRFQREQRMAAAIEHPNVVPVHAVGEEDGELYLAMRYVGGTDLHALIRREGPLGRLAPRRSSGRWPRRWTPHAAALVHRDVKPANVLVAGRREEGARVPQRLQPVAAAGL